MRPNVSLRTLLFSLLLIIIFVTSAAAEVKIGILAPLTGDLAAWGSQTFRAAQIAAEEINLTGGINGVKLHLIVHDTEGKLYSARRGAKSLIKREKVAAIIGDLTNSEAMFVSSLATENEIPLINVLASNPRVTSDKPWVFRTNLTFEKLLMAGLSKWKARHQIRKAAIIFDKSWETLFAESNIKIPEILKHNEIDLMDLISFYRSETNLENQLKKKIWSDSRYGVIINSFAFETANVFRKLSNLKYENPVYAVKAPYPELDAKHFRSDQSFNFAVTFWSESSNPMTVRFIEKFKEKVGEDILDASPAEMFDSIIIIKSILERFDVDPNNIRRIREIIKNGWKELSNFQGASGTFSIDRNGDAEREVFLISAERGIYQLID